MRAVVIGGNGFLGSTLVKTLRANPNVGCVVNVGQRAVEDATHNVLFPTEGRVSTSFEQILAGLQEIGPFDAIYNVAGGWTGGSLQSDSLLTDFDRMLEASLMTSVLAAKLGSKIFIGSRAPVLVLTGSEAAFKPTPGMIAYGTSKAATHYFANTLAANPEAAGLPKGCRVKCICPDTLDTPANRAAMPSADYSKWTKLPDLAGRMANWMLHPTSDNSEDVFVHV